MTTFLLVSAVVALSVMLFFANRRADREKHKAEDLEIEANAAKRIAKAESDAPRTRSDTAKRVRTRGL